MERSKSKKKTISEINNENGDKITNSKEILKVFKEFYSKLFTGEPINIDSANDFLKDVTKLDETLVEWLDYPILKKEILIAFRKNFIYKILTYLVMRFCNCIKKYFLKVLCLHHYEIRIYL
jgi:hypothetical protein